MLALAALALAVVDAGRVELVLQDAARHGRRVRILFHYPEGAARPVPLVVMAHCFMGGASWYEYLAKALVDEGYAFASLGTHEYLPATSDQLAPDQAFVLDELRRRGREDTAFPLYGRLEGGLAAAMGHSLGGAASYYSVNKGSAPLHGRYTADFATVLTMSACCGWDDKPRPGVCESRGGPDEALKATRVPSLQLTGSNDCICPPRKVAKPFFRDLGSACKYLVDISGATHCHFDDIPGPIGGLADDVCVLLEDGFCRLAEAGTITKRQQQGVVVGYALGWLDWTLRGNASAAAAFDAKARADAAANITSLTSRTDGCPSTVTV